MGFVLGTALIIGGSILVGSAISASQANTASKREADRAKTAEGRLAIRQEQMDAREIPDISRHFEDISGMMNNQMKDLQVSTAAAEFEAEQQNIGLANMQQSMTAFGFGGGGATALLQGQLAGRRGISADIQKQEATNRFYEAQGEQQVMMAKAGEARRMQAMAAESETWGFAAAENRDAAYMDRQSGLATGHRTNQYQLELQRNEIWGSALPNAVMGGAMAYGMAKG